jgi:hypothetical protein
VTALVEVAPLTSWADAGVPIPPPSRREPNPHPRAAEETGVWLIAEHAAVAAAVTARSSADFRPLAALVDDRRDALRRAFDAREVLPPSLVAELAPLLAPRLERLAHRLRRRLARTRELVPLHRAREMDPACMRRNARLPGRTLVEKAGPEQELVAVERIERFDTTENRMLVAACRRLVHLGRNQLARIPRDAAGRRVRDLRGLVVRAEAVLARPELDGIGPPRPGDRPSNAMLGNADYRAVWRAWQLLRAEEERFADAWGRMDALWTDLVELAIWAELDRCAEFEAVPTWMSIDETLRIGTARRWMRVDGVTAEEVIVERASHALRVTLRRFDPSGTVGTETTEVPAALAVLDGQVVAQGCGGPDREGAIALIRQVSGLLGAMPAVTDRLASAERVALCALDAHIVIRDEHGPREVEPAAVARIPGPDGSVFSTFGLSATWVAGASGPTGLHREAAELGGELVARHAGTHETAVVVPDAIDEIGLVRLRRRAGRMWAVWAPVAAALAAAETGKWPADPVGVLVVVQTAATLDVAVLELRTVETPMGPDRLWIRSAPSGRHMAGREHEQIGDDDAVRRAWLRSPGAEPRWMDSDGGLALVDAPPPTSSVVDAVVERAGRWRGLRVASVVLCGVGGKDERELRTSWPDRAFVVLSSPSLAEGAWIFLERRAAGRPTWKDRLPALDLLANQGRIEKAVPIVKRGELVEPGQQVAMESEDAFSIPLGRTSVSFRLQREGVDAGFVLRLEGPPLPLREPVRVKVRVRFRHGLQGIEGSLVPVGPAPFDHLPFRFEIGEAPIESGTPIAPPPAEPLRAPPADLLPRIRRAADDLRTGWERLSPRDRKSPAQAWEAAEPLVRALDESLRQLTGSSAEAMPAPLRALLETAVAPPIDGLLGIVRRKSAVELPPKARTALYRCRARARVRGDGAFASHLLTSGEVDAATRAELVGFVVDGRADDVWKSLVDLPAQRAHERGAWASAVSVSLRADPALVLAIGTDADRVLVRTVDLLERTAREPDPARHKQTLFRLAQVVPWLCHARQGGGLSDAVVEDAVVRLAAVRHALPESVRAFGESSAVGTNREPLRVAIAWLTGDYSTPPDVETR